jgi:NAD(P)-dependent dehydrogenase (short-subunit alcohol dehydrogenase family)
MMHRTVLHVSKRSRESKGRADDGRELSGKGRDRHRRGERPSASHGRALRGGSARVVIADVDAARGEELTKQLGAAAAFKRADVSNPDEVQDLVDFAVARFGGLHVVFNNAGIAEPIGRFLDDELADFSRIMAVNLLGVMVGSQRAARHMAKNGGGAIINNSSIGGINAGAGVMTYRASKAAVTHFSKSIAIELAPHGIRVNCVAPGHIATEMTPYDMQAVVRRTQPLQRQGTPEDGRETAVLYLASEQVGAGHPGSCSPVEVGRPRGTPSTC